jgi:hypothetical protein
MTVSAPIPTTGVAFGNAAFSEGVLSCCEFCVLAQPVKLNVSAITSVNLNTLRSLMIPLLGEKTPRAFSLGAQPTWLTV